MTQAGAFLQWIDRSPSFWGFIGGFVATFLKHRQTRSLPIFERPQVPKFMYIADYPWNAFLGWVLAHVYAISGNLLNPFGGLVTGGAAPTLLAQLFDAAGKQHLPGTKPPQEELAE